MAHCKCVFVYVCVWFTFTLISNLISFMAQEHTFLESHFYFLRLVLRPLYAFKNALYSVIVGYCVMIDCVDQIFYILTDFPYNYMDFP